MTLPSGRNFYLKTEGQKWHVSFCLIFLTCCWETCWGNIFCSSNYWKGQQPRGHSKLNVLSKPSMSIPSSPKVHIKYLWHSCCQLTTFWPHWAIFEFTAVYDAKRNRTEEVIKIQHGVTTLCITYTPNDTQNRLIKTVIPGSFFLQLFTAAAPQKRRANRAGELKKPGITVFINRFSVS